MEGLAQKLLKEKKAVNEDQLVALSDEAINLVVIQTLADPDNSAQVKVLEGTRRGNYSQDCKMMTTRNFSRFASGFRNWRE